VPGDRLASLVAGHRLLAADATWLYLTDPRMPVLEHGWKLHISARPDRLAATMDRVVPVLLRHTCDVKFARDQAVLRDLNSGLKNSAAVGKAITVYPQHSELVGLAEELVAALMGWTGPRVVSDRRLHPNAPVYYRYGPFRAALRPGALELTMVGPGGETFPGLAEAGYRRPPWASDPFPAVRAEAPTVAGIGGGRYRITAGIVRSPQGHVYRAIDVESARKVVIKQARAYVAEDADGVDARGRLRNERRLLTALAGVDGVPELVDYFRHGDDEYLVMTDCGARDLRRDVNEYGPYSDGGGGRDWHRLAGRLLAVLDRVHARGVVVCDLKPGNVVVDEAGRPHLVDFGVSGVDGAGLDGATPGYSLPVRRAAEPPRPVDDYYALGATLGYALTGLDPVIIDADHATNRDRTLACLTAVLPDRHPGRSIVAGLLSLDPAERAATAERLRAALPPVPRATQAPPRVTDDLLDDVIGHAVDFCVDRAVDLAASPRNAEAKVTIYDGSAGLGLELLHHTDRPDVRAAVAQLARWTAEMPMTGLSSALYCGTAGVALFLAAASLSHDMPPDPGPAVADQLSGLAGTGTGHLLLASQDDSRAHLAIAADCARRLINGEGAEDTARRPAIDTAALAQGFAHGRAGIAYFLLAHHQATGDPASDAAARAACAALAAETPDLLAEASRPGATRRYGSWCRGLAGIGTVLIQAGDHYQDDSMIALAKETGRACRALAPRMALVSQCCGLSGVGELLVDLAVATGDEESWQAAEDIAALILARSGGPVRRPIFPDNTFSSPNAEWATGTPGVLSFLRRLRHHGGPRIAMPSTGTTNRL
jgi:serine/threonine protein kinase